MLSLLLHMHQPDYRDPRSGAPGLPWVRLHATRGYRDVPRIIADTGARVTVNLVPSLVDQWDHYARGGSDPWLDLARRSPETLDAAEIHWMRAHFFAGHPATYRWFARWGELRARDVAGERFDVGDLRDLQVWSQLVWFGFSARREFPLVCALHAKARDFTEEDKHLLLDLQIEIIRELGALYRGVPEISCSPYYHPILPLLIDTAHARRCIPDVPDPGFRAPDDARLQLERARTRISAWAGRDVRGLWPSEGSVSPEVVALAAQAGFRWFATDEGILARSKRDPGEGSGPWEVGAMRGLFRDRGLSDRIGFVYGSWEGEAAATDFMARMPAGPVLVALDGENPWEGYRDAGEAFLRALLGRSATRTCGELAEDPPRGRIHALHTGSWINADFRIWIGHSEDRVAWTLLAQARAAWEARGRPEHAREHLLAAEGSDWFWWYGDEFSTPFADHFDRLFRAHLAAAWTAMGAPVPAALGTPIKGSRASPIEPPRGALPDTDGEDWFAWAPAGRVELRAGAMAPMRGAPRALFFGLRKGRPVLRLVPGGEGWKVLVGDAQVPFTDDRATLPAEGPVALVGPSGERLPPEGTWTLPWAAGVGPTP